MSRAVSWPTALPSRCKFAQQHSADQSLTFALSYDCNGTSAQNWVINDDETTVQVAGTNFCLDAGTSKHLLSITVNGRTLMAT